MAHPPPCTTTFDANDRCVCVFERHWLDMAEQGSNALREIAHFESWKQAVITARRGRQHLHTKIRQKEERQGGGECELHANVQRENLHLIHERNFMVAAAWSLAFVIGFVKLACMSRVKKQPWMLGAGSEGVVHEAGIVRFNLKFGIPYRGLEKKGRKSGWFPWPRVQQVTATNKETVHKAAFFKCMSTDCYIKTKTTNNPDKYAKTITRVIPWPHAQAWLQSWFSMWIKPSLIYFSKRVSQYVHLNRSWESG